MIKIESSFDTVVEVRLLRLKQGMQILYYTYRRGLSDAVVLGKIESALCKEQLVCVVNIAHM